MRMIAAIAGGLGMAAALLAADPLLPGSQSVPGRLDASLAHETRAALDRGLTWLAERQNPDGSWTGPDGTDLTALPLLAFAGSPNPAHQALRRQGAAWLSRSATNGALPVLMYSGLALAREALEKPELRPLLPVLRDRLAATPLPDEPRLLALRLLALQSLPAPPPALESTQRLARATLQSGVDAAAVLLGFQAAGAPRNDPVMWKAFHWLAGHREAFSPATATETHYENLLILALALAQTGENRLPLPDRSLLAWRPLLARTLINRQKVDPRSGSLYWTPAEGPPPRQDLAATCYALLTLQVVLAE
jgi:hypothetical protein